MKAALILTLAAAGSAGGLSIARSPLFGGAACAGATPCCAASAVSCETDSPPAATVVGDHVEARSASVFAGACHTGSEAASQGRQALLAWSIEAGSHADHDLAGVRIAAAVSGADNLDGSGERTSVVFIDASDSATERAAQSWLEQRHGEVLGAVVAWESERVRFERSGAEFLVGVDGTLELAGEALTDGSCCTMQEERYYEPLAAAAGAVVGVPYQCRFTGFGELPAWRFEDSNSAFVTRFEEPAAARASHADGASAGEGEAPRSCCPAAAECGGLDA